MAGSFAKAHLSTEHFGARQDTEQGEVQYESDGNLLWKALYG
jgi:hypothetical protein